jgi:hypothetical protein
MAAVMWGGAAGLGEVSVLDEVSVSGLHLV